MFAAGRSRRVIIIAVITPWGHVFRRRYRARSYRPLQKHDAPVTPQPADAHQKHRFRFGDRTETVTTLFHYPTANVSTHKRTWCQHIDNLTQVEGRRPFWRKDPFFYKPTKP